MANIQFLFESELLVEISLQDHYDKFGDKFNVDDYERYQQIAKLDPTSNDGKIKGKYTEWLLKQFGDMSDSVFEANVKDNDYKKWLEGLGNIKGFDINQYKSLDDLKDYYNSLDEEDLLSSKEKKKRQKNILQNSEHVKIIYKDAEYIVAKPITKQGNILLARYKCPESAKWCTADPNNDSHWERYMERGELFSVIPLANPEEKFHVYVEDGYVDELRDFEDDDYMEEGLEILKELDEKSEGQLREQMGVEEFERSQLKLEISNEESAIYYIFGQPELFDYFNRSPSDTEAETGDYVVEFIADLDIRPLTQKFFGGVFDYGVEGDMRVVRKFVEVLESAIESEHMTKMEIESFFDLVADEEFEVAIERIGEDLAYDLENEEIENPKQYVINFLEREDLRNYLEETTSMLIHQIELRLDITINKPWEDEEEVQDRILDYLNIEESKKPTWAKFV